MEKTLFVVDHEAALTLASNNTVTFATYLNDYPKRNQTKLRVINLCDTDRYLSQGYYCSLLAEARQHQVLPSIKTINALNNEAAEEFWVNETLASADSLEGDELEILVCMGEVQNSLYQKLASSIFQEYPSPLLTLHVLPDQTGARITIKRPIWMELSDLQHQFCRDVFDRYDVQRWRKKGGRKNHRWEMAILVNPEEQVPPSNRGALSRFVKAGDKHGIQVNLVTAADLHDIDRYDALFLRETTAIDHITYRLACAAEKRGLVVMDDPDSILRCCNKVFLHDAFNYKQVPSLKTVFISDTEPTTLDQLETNFGYPLILKMPEGSFSRGVFKIKDRPQLQQVLTNLLEESALVLAQEYMFTDYDWRIGMLNGRALYACRYYMARNHWQIYNHSSKRNFSGGFDSLPTFEVPRKVLEAAHRAAAVVGNGLYGIDIKELNGQAYVLEVNDNPSIDHGVEDKYLGDELYMQIMAEFLRRLEARGR
ncbi:RimK family protein [Litoribrevibacter albus]|uniref:Carboxylate--amine ligase n=1 Tax=Litoribrevibacter albus TaxID=1473156 RepID=A0AA37W6P0_9GAMM|nr:RimK family protein [Litoribrevibacter albus]GLQ29666.1 carboxylate--amine ligase [Litoribrevibacter albus]